MTVSFANSILRYSNTRRFVSHCHDTYSHATDEDLCIYLNLLMKTKTFVEKELGKCLLS